jgi:hypothetical protein
MKNPNVTLNDNGTATITLSREAVFAGVKVKTLTMREPTIGDQLVVEHHTKASDMEINLFANLMDQAPDDIKKLPLRDYQRVQAAFGLFTD